MKKSLSFESAVLRIKVLLWGVWQRYCYTVWLLWQHDGDTLYTQNVNILCWSVCVRLDQDIWALLWGADEEHSQLHGCKARAVSSDALHLCRNVVLFTMVESDWPGHATAREKVCRFLLLKFGFVLAWRGWARDVKARDQDETEMLTSRDRDVGFTSRDETLKFRDETETRRDGCSSRDVIEMLK